MALGAAAPRIAIELRFDQLEHGAAPVAEHAGGFAAGSRDDALADHQQAVLVARHEALDDDPAALVGGDAPGGFDFLAGVKAGEHAASVVAVDRLDDNRQPDRFGCCPGFIDVGDDLPLGHRYAATREQSLAEILVARDGLGDRAGAVGLGGPDPPLVRAVAELHQVAIVHPCRGDTTGDGGIDNAGGARSEAVLVGQGPHSDDGFVDIEGAVLDRRHQQVARFIQRRFADCRGCGSDHNLVHAALRGFAGAAEAGGDTRQGEQFESEMLEDMARPGAFVQPLQEPAALADAAAMLDQGRHPGDEPVGQAIDQVGRKILEIVDVDDCLEHGPVGPQVGTAHMANAHDLDRLVHFTASSGRERAPQPSVQFVSVR